MPIMMTKRYEDEYESYIAEQAKMMMMNSGTGTIPTILMDITGSDEMTQQANLITTKTAGPPGIFLASNIGFNSQTWRQ